MQCKIHPNSYVQFCHNQRSERIIIRLITEYKIPPSASNKENILICFYLRKLDIRVFKEYVCGIKGDEYMLNKDIYTPNTNVKSSNLSNNSIHLSLSLSPCMIVFKNYSSNRDIHKVLSKRGFQSIMLNVLK